jgi:hypothetical protein
VESEPGQLVTACAPRLYAGSEFPYYLRFSIYIPKEECLYARASLMRQCGARSVSIASLNSTRVRFKRSCALPLTVSTRRASRRGPTHYNPRPNSVIPYLGVGHPIPGIFHIFLRKCFASVRAPVGQCPVYVSSFVDGCPPSILHLLLGVQFPRILFMFDPPFVTYKPN